MSYVLSYDIEHAAALDEVEELQKQLNKANKALIKSRKQYNHLKSQIVALVIATAITASLVGSFVTFMVMKDHPKVVEASQTAVSVEEGDTLWNIAREYCPSEMDVRDYIHLVCKVNDREEPVVYVGEDIILPIFKEVKY